MVRTAPAMLSPKMWNRFVWPYFKRLVYEVLEYAIGKGASETRQIKEITAEISDDGE